MTAMVTEPASVVPPPQYTRAQLHGRECIVCGDRKPGLVPAGHVYTEPAEPGTNPHGWPVNACPADLSAARALTGTDTMTEQQTSTDTYAAYHAAMRLMYALDAAGIELIGGKGIVVDGVAVASITMPEAAAPALAALLAPHATVPVHALPDAFYPADAYVGGLERALDGLGDTGLWAEHVPGGDVRLRGEAAAAEKLAALVEEHAA